MFDQWNSHVDKFEKIIELYRNHINDKDTLNYIDILEGEFILYHSFNCKYNFLKFIIRFFISLFYQTNSKLIFSGNESTDFTFVNTVDYIYYDNLYPIIKRINNLGKKTSSIELCKTQLIILPHFFNFKNKFPLLKILRNNEIYSSKTNLILTLYTYFITIPRIQFIQNLIEDKSNKIGNIILSSDSCDIFSRTISIHAQKSNKYFILIQNGPIQEDSIEWKSSISNEIIIWKESEEYFKEYNKNYKIFFPPRFYYTLENNLFSTKKYELVVFLPWVLPNKNGKLLLNFINDFLFYLTKISDSKIYIKYHPASNIKLNDISFLDFPINSNTKDILINSKAVINFGSTISYDCNYLNIPCAVVNIMNQLPDSSPLFRLNTVKNIRNYNDIEIFLSKPNFFSTQNVELSYSLIPYLISKHKNNYA